MSFLLAKCKIQTSNSVLVLLTYFYSPHKQREESICLHSRKVLGREEGHGELGFGSSKFFDFGCACYGA